MLGHMRSFRLGSSLEDSSSALLEDVAEGAFLGDWENHDCNFRLLLS